MKKSYYIFLLTALTFSFSNLKAWDTTAAKFYPLSVGNVYVFNHIDLSITCSPYQFLGIYQVRITDYILKPNGKKYFKFLGWWQLWGTWVPNWKYQRIDSVSMNVYAYDSTTNGEFLFDSLLANVGNSFRCQRFSYQIPFGIYENYSTQNLFGQNRILKRILSLVGGVSFYYNLVEGIGFNGYSACEFGGEEYRLKGCIINGVVYGDTTLTNITQISNIVPENFSLSQNFPNPFNPKTIINYELPITNFVTLKVFDVLGKEVATLVNEKQNAGSYEVEFNGINLSSGVYFYRIAIHSDKLETEKFFETKRMILLK